VLDVGIEPTMRYRDRFTVCCPTLRLIQRSALGRNRTCDLRIRSSPLSPLSYKGKYQIVNDSLISDTTLILVLMRYKFVFESLIASSEYDL
jgi:hypothetical protein